MANRLRIIYLEPYDAGSHAGFTQVLTSRVPARWTVLTLPGRHWKWRMRGSAPYFALAHREALSAPADLLVASAYLPLAELIGLVPALSGVPSVLYFHENQLAYPVREVRERDDHFGISQLVSALAATCCAFNSAHNRDSFLAAAETLLARLPDCQPPGWVEAVRERARVLPVPLALPDRAPALGGEPEREAGPVILWNHRWEYDKDPAAFFAALEQLADEGVPFRVIVCGQRFRQAPAVFAAARARLGERVLHWGFAPERAAYEALLARADVAVSTAVHEFFGVAMLEATHHGAYPLVPDRLAYPEIFPAEHRYRGDGDLVARLRGLCQRYCQQGGRLRADRRALTAPFGAPLIARYEALFRDIAGRG